MISVSNLIHATQPALVKKWPRLAKLLIKVLQWAIKEHKFHEFKRLYPDTEGVAFADKVLEFVGFRYHIDDQQLQKIPTQGPLVIVSNHPIGSLDGLALVSMVSRVRPEAKILANEMLSQLEPLRPSMIAIKVFGSSKRNQIEEAKQHLNSGAPLIIFPAGKVSRYGKQGIKDDEWKSGFLRLAQANQTPVLPIHVSGKNSTFFYALSFISPALSTLWLVRELFKQKGNCSEFTVGQVIPYSTYMDTSLSTNALCQRFKEETYRVGQKQPSLFSGQTPTDSP